MIEVYCTCALAICTLGPNKVASIGRWLPHRGIHYKGSTVLGECRARGGSRNKMGCIRGALQEDICV